MHHNWPTITVWTRTASTVSAAYAARFAFRRARQPDNCNLVRNVQSATAGRCDAAVNVTTFHWPAVRSTVLATPRPASRAEFVTFGVFGGRRVRQCASCENFTILRRVQLKLLRAEQVRKLAARNWPAETLQRLAEFNHLYVVN